MSLGDADGNDGFVTFDRDDIREYSSNGCQMWVDGSTWTAHGCAAGAFDLKWVTHLDAAGNVFMQVTAIRTPYNGDWDNERALFEAVHAACLDAEVEDHGRSVCVIAKSTRKRKVERDTPAPAWVLEERHRNMLSPDFCQRTLEGADPCQHDITPASTEA